MPNRTIRQLLVKVEILAGAATFGDAVLNPVTYTVKVHRGHEHFGYTALTREEAAKRVLEALDSALGDIPDAG